MEPNVPQSPLLHVDEPDTSAVRVSLGSSIVTAIFRGTGAPPAVTVGLVGEILTTGPVAAVMVKVSESETPEPFAAVNVMVTEFGVGGAGGARYVAVISFCTSVPAPESDNVAPIVWVCSTLAVN